MKALVVGLGSIGRRHLANLMKIVPGAEVTVWRRREQMTTVSDQSIRIEHVVYSLEDALATEPELAIIATPAPFHIQTGLDLARQGISLLIEKPLSDNLAGTSELIDVCRSNDLTLMVGYNLRFLHSMQILQRMAKDGQIGHVLSVIAEVGQYLPDWRPGSDYSQTVSASSRLGGGVLLELSHEMDYVRWLIGEVETVNAQIALLDDLKMDAENVADIVLRFTTGILGNIHLDMLQRTPARKCKLIGTQGTLVWDGIANTVRLFSAESKMWHDVFIEQAWDRNEMYILELQHFLDCVQSKSQPLVTGEDGLRGLEIILAARESARLQKTIYLKGMFSEKY